MRRWLFWCTLVAALVVACSRDDSAPSTVPAGAAARGGPLVVVAMNAPLACFAKRIGGDAVSVTMPVPPGLDPAFWTPSADDVAAMQRADLVVLNGAGHEPWRVRSALVDSKVVETSNGFRDRWIELAEGVTHSHGLAGEHTHKGTSFTTWIDPQLALEQARAIADALKRARPDAAASIDERLAALATELEAIDAAIADAIHGQQSLPIVFSHPVYDYLARRYALNARYVHWEPEEMPSAEEWERFAALLKEHPARWMIWEEEPADAVRSKLAEMGVSCVAFRPAGNPGGDPAAWLDIQRQNAKELAKVYE
ncbi:MAG: metal ABC transporter substrate-binding protein [Phycisphaerales bacterium]